MVVIIAQKVELVADLDMRHLSKNGNRYLIKLINEFTAYNAKKLIIFQLWEAIIFLWEELQVFLIFFSAL